MKRDPKVLLWDARESAKAIAGMTDGKSFTDFDGDIVLRSAIERQFEILGEALNRLQKSDSALADQIPEHRQIISFRNVLIHGYDTIDEAVVWKIIQQDLPTLKQQVESMLAAPGSS